jgi:hypothetical protein
MVKTSYRLLWLCVPPLLALLSCSTITNITQRAGEVRETAMILATGAQEGRDLIATGQSAISTLEDSGAVQTLQALATEHGPSIQATIEAFATQQGPALLETGAAFATQQGPSLKETLASLATNELPGLLGTIEAAATQVGSGKDERPADIPLPKEVKDILLATPGLVSFTTSLSQPEVQDFYSREMPANGWTLSEGDPVVLNDLALFLYTKGERSAHLTINPISGEAATAVVIVIEGR